MYESFCDLLRLCTCSMHTDVRKFKIVSIHCSRLTFSTSDPANFTSKFTLKCWKSVGVMHGGGRSFGCQHKRVGGCNWTACVHKVVNVGHGGIDNNKQKPVFFIITAEKCAFMAYGTYLNNNCILE